MKAILTLKDNPRYFYSYAKKFAKSKTTIGPLLDSENNLQQDPEKMANLLQDQYSSVFSDPNSKKRNHRKPIKHMRRYLRTYPLKKKTSKKSYLK